MLYPGTGFAEEVGVGVAEGTKLNIHYSLEMVMQSFRKSGLMLKIFWIVFLQIFYSSMWSRTVYQADPITHLELSEQSHYHAAKKLTELAERHAQGRIIALGGGGYNRDNIGKAWTHVG
jgi:acetoin utilization protein AcuC